ncbi:MAG: class I SAM-dependent methyltransferase [Gemmatimonadaceae bacterium]
MSSDPAISRLTRGIEPPELRAIMMHCLDGSVSPAVTLMKLLIETEDASATRAAVDEVTQRAATLSRATDSLLRDRVDDLTQMVIENETGCEKIAGMLRANVDSPEPAESVEKGVAFCEQLFDWSVQQSPEASVALYSLGNPQLLERATREVVALLAQWKVTGPDRTVLDIGCGIGRIAAELASHVREIHGIDVSGRMIDAALRNCSGLANVRLTKTSGHDLQDFADSSFDAAVAVDTFPYIHQSGPALVAKIFAECARVLRPSGDMVILNYSYSGTDESQVEDVRRLASANAMDVIVAGTRPFTIWDGAAFHLRKRAASA